MRLTFMSIFAVLSLTACPPFDDDPDQDGGGAACEVGDESYPSGTDNILAPDGCNHCTCRDGELQCTLLGCLPGQCIVNGKSYPAGTDDIPAPDGCNACTCNEDGTLSCTAKGCVPGHRSCKVDGVDYASGQSGVPAPDGCNTCTCEDGVLGSCTEIACLPAAACIVNGKTYASGESDIKDPFSCNRCLCDDGQLICTEAYCPEGECPPNSVPGRACAQCGPTDACEAYEFGCMIVCESDEHCPAGTTRDWCVEGTCRTLCG